MIVLANLVFYGSGEMYRNMHVIVLANQVCFFLIHLRCFTNLHYKLFAL